MEQKNKDFVELCREIGLPSQVLHITYPEDFRSMFDYTERVNYNHYFFSGDKSKKKYLAAAYTSDFGGLEFYLNLFSIPNSILPVIQDSISYPQSQEGCSRDRMSSPEMVTGAFGVPSENLTHLGSYLGDSRNYNKRDQIWKLLLLLDSRKMQSSIYTFGKGKFILDRRIEFTEEEIAKLTRNAKLHFDLDIRPLGCGNWKGPFAI